MERKRKVLLGYFLYNFYRILSENVKKGNLKNEQISEKQAKVLFSFRCRVNNTKVNFKNKYQGNMICDLCKIEPCTNEHLFTCKILRKLVPELQSTNIKYEHIFGSIEEMVAVSTLLLKITEERDTVMSLLTRK